MKQTISITSFPVEILAEIMSKAIRTPNTPNNEQVINLCHVCRHWRTVCLSTPYLRSSVDVSHPKLGWEFLKNCKDTPIDLYAIREHRFSPFWPSDVDEKNQLRDVLTTHWSQVRSLNCHASNALLQVLGEAPVQMPLLRSIRLYTTTYFHVLQWHPVIGERYSNVHTLILDGVYVPLETPWFRDMVYLIVQLSHAVPEAPSMESLLRILESSPRLEVLRLEWAGPRLDESQDVRNARKVVTLPNLLELSLTNTPQIIAQVLFSISVAPPTIVHLSCEVEDCAECVAILFCPGSTLLNFISASQQLRLQVDDGIPRIRVQTNATEVSIMARHLGDSRRWLSQFPRATNQLWNLYHMGLETLELSIGETCHLGVHQWTEVFEHPHLETLQTLRLSSLHQRQFAVVVSALYTRPSSSGRPMLPSLRRLILPVITVESDNVKLLKEYLDWRVQAGVKLERLEGVGNRWGYEMQHGHDLVDVWSTE
jgi:hypothetical protein